MMPILIGIHGLKRAGKDTVASFIREFAEVSYPPLSFCRRGFADKIKWSFARQFFPEITLEDAVAWCDQWKVDETARFISDTAQTLSDSGWPITGPLGGNEVDFREALANFGTHSSREIFGEDFWVDQLLSFSPDALLWHYNFDFADVCVVTDVRYLNEIIRIKRLGGIAIKVRRREAEQGIVDEANRKGKQVHISELGIEDDRFDFIIHNHLGLDSLQRTVKTVWQEITEDDAR